MEPPSKRRRISRSIPVIVISDDSSSEDEFGAPTVISALPQRLQSPQRLTPSPESVQRGAGVSMDLESDTTEAALAFRLAVVEAIGDAPPPPPRRKKKPSTQQRHNARFANVFSDDELLNARHGRSEFDFCWHSDDPHQRIEQLIGLSSPGFYDNEVKRVEQLLMYRPVSVLRPLYHRYVGHMSRKKKTMAHTMAEMFILGKTKEVSDVSKRRMERTFLQDRSNDEIQNFFTFRIRDLSIQAQQSVRLRSVTVPKDVISQVLSFMVHDSHLLNSVGLLNSSWYLAVLSTWKSLVISNRKLLSIPVPVLQSLSEAFLQFKIGLTNDEYNYLFQNLNPTTLEFIMIPATQNKQACCPFYPIERFFETICQYNLRRLLERDSPSPLPPIFDRVECFKFPDALATSGPKQKARFSVWRPNLPACFPLLNSVHNPCRTSMLEASMWKNRSLRVLGLCSRVIDAQNLAAKLLSGEIVRGVQELSFRILPEVALVGFQRHSLTLAHLLKSQAEFICRYFVTSLRKLVVDFVTGDALFDTLAIVSYFEHGIEDSQEEDPVPSPLPLTVVVISKNPTPRSTTHARPLGAILSRYRPVSCIETLSVMGLSLDEVRSVLEFCVGLKRLRVDNFISLLSRIDGTLEMLDSLEECYLSLFQQSLLYANGVLRFTFMVQQQVYQHRVDMESMLDTFVTFGVNHSETRLQFVPASGIQSEAERQEVYDFAKDVEDGIASEKRDNSRSSQPSANDDSGIILID